MLCRGCGKPLALKAQDLSAGHPGCVQLVIRRDIQARKGLVAWPFPWWLVLKSPQPTHLPWAGY